MAIEPSRRSWSDTRSGLRDTDSFRRARFVKAFGWASFPAFFMGIALTMMVGPRGGFLGALAILFGVAGFSLFWSEGIGSLTGAFLHPGAGARDVGNSRADALLARGEFKAAANEWEITAADNPDAPGPPAQVARIYRDHLGDPAQAVRWFRKSIEVAGLDGGVRVTMRELVEAARKIDGTGRAAAPVLARYAEVTAGTEEGVWAAEELARIKAAMAEEG